jgi:antitoxin component of MazEF toxin-antitoxin module
MQLLITRWGHSAGIRVPAFIMKSLGLRPGDSVSMRLLDSGDLRVRPIKKDQLIPADPGNSTDIAMDRPAQVEEVW